jgi:hypothetical protein
VRLDREVEDLNRRIRNLTDVRLANPLVREVDRRLEWRIAMRDKGLYYAKY